MFDFERESTRDGFLCVRFRRGNVDESLLPSPRPALPRSLPTMIRKTFLKITIQGNARRRWSLVAYMRSDFLS